MRAGSGERPRGFAILGEALDTSAWREENTRSPTPATNPGVELPMAGDTKGLRRLWNACGYSWAGLCAAWRYEEAFRQEIMLVGALVPVAIWLARSPLELALILGSGLLVLIVELLNSAVEAVTDRVGLERHELSARAKDLGSAAVMLSLMLMGIVWSGVIWQRFSQD